MENLETHSSETAPQASVSERLEALARRIRALRPERNPETFVIEKHEIAEELRAMKGELA